MDDLPVLGCFCSPFLTVLLILIPVVIVKSKGIPREYKEYQQAIRQIETEFRLEVDIYNRLKYQNRFKSLAELKRMKPADFERHIAYIFQQMGYQAQATKYSGDGGIDVEARRGGQFVAIQCKRYADNHKISSPELRNFIGAMAVSKADYGYFVTTSSFTQPAVREATQLKNLTLVDGPGIVDWWREYKIGPYQDLVPPKKRSYPPEPPPPPPPKIFGFTVWQWITLVLLGQVAIFVFSFLIAVLTKA